MATHVTLRFGDELLELECESVEIPDSGSIEFPKQGIPEGYIRLEAAEEYDPTGIGQVPFVGEGNTALVSDEHVAMIQWDDEED
ncbi:hypothetical protein [Natrinema sp. DC36]|uniref:hypothetical protein n=1 Tax=Natrinema sp. DC36 TaxID=2878680 RepID=UPI001CF036CE|nr:hypothetical protein [Natrinema sp. DC36]